MAFHTIWSIDLGKSSLKAVKLRRERNNIEILAVDKIDYPLSKNGVDAAAQAKEALGIFRSRHEVGDPVAVIHPGQGTFYRSIKVPATDDKKLSSMVGYEASQQIPFPLDEVVWDYQLIQRDYLPGEEREVALFAVRREAMDDFLLDFQNENLPVEMVSIGYLGLLNFVIHDIQPQEPSIVLDIGASHTDLLLVDGKRFWIRPLPHSGSDVTQTIANRFKLPFPEAEKLKIEAGKVPQQAVKIFQAVIQPKLKDLVGEIHRSIGYYRSQAGDVSFKHLYLMGNGAKIVGIKKYLEEQLGVQVHKVQSINHFRVNREVNLKLLQADLPSFAAALGGGLQALDAATCKVDLVPKEERLRKALERKRRHAFIAAGVVLVALIAATIIIRSGSSGTDSTIASAQRLVDQISKAEKQLKATDAGGGGLDEIRALQGSLERVGESRRLVIDGLTALDRVLAKFDNAKLIEVVEKAGTDEQSRQAIQQYREEGVRKNLWIPTMKVTSTHYPEPPETKKEQIPPGAVPAVRFEAHVVIAMRGDLTSSSEFVRREFAEQIETEVRALGRKLPVAVQVNPGTETTVIYADTGRAPERSASAEPEEGAESTEAPEQFYRASVIWFVTARMPSEPDETASDADESEDEEASPKRKKKGSDVE